jgi:hypothetical protein
MDFQLSPKHSPFDIMSLTIALGKSALRYVFGAIRTEYRAFISLTKDCLIENAAKVLLIRIGLLGDSEMPHMSTHRYQNTKELRTTCWNKRKVAVEESSTDVNNNFTLDAFDDGFDGNDNQLYNTTSNGFEYDHTLPLNLLNYMEGANAIITTVKEKYQNSLVYRTLYLPMYDPKDGRCTDEEGILIDIVLYERDNTLYHFNYWTCPCPIYKEASQIFLDNVEGREDKICYHQQYLRRSALSQVLLEKPLSDSIRWFDPDDPRSYFVLCPNVANQFLGTMCRLYVYCANADPMGSMCTIKHDGSVRCSRCQRKPKKKKNKAKKSANNSIPSYSGCLHYKLIKRFINTSNMDLEGTDEKLNIIKEIYHKGIDENNVSCYFDTEAQLWVVPSCSWEIEQEMKRKFGIDPIGVPRSIDIYLNKIADAVPSSPVDLIPKIPSYPPPLSWIKRCSWTTTEVRAIFITITLVVYFLFIFCYYLLYIN